MKNALIFFGGVSSEHDISLISAKSVIENVPKDKYNVIAVGITKDGEWYKYDGDVSLLPGEKWLEDSSKLTRVMLSPSHKDHGLMVFNGGGFTLLHIDVAFPVLHGKNGEDGTIQGLLQIAGIPFVGCDMLSSACCMDKAVTNALADQAGISQAKWTSFIEFDYRQDPDKYISSAAEKLGFPIFVKPANAGSSVGITKAVDVDTLRNAIEIAFREDRKVVLEEGITGQEVECAVLGNDDPIASICGEIVPCNDFYDFDAKYIDASSELHIPARLPNEKIEEIMREARRVYKAMGCSGLARVDFFVRKSDGKIMFNELNTIPGFTSISMYPKLFEVSGVPYSELIDRLFGYALEKWDV